MDDHFDSFTGIEVTEIGGRDRLAGKVRVAPSENRAGHRFLPSSRYNNQLCIENESSIDLLHGVEDVVRTCSWLDTAKIFEEDRSS